MLLISNVIPQLLLLQATTFIKEIEIIHRLFLVIVMYCQASSSQIQWITKPPTLLAGKVLTDFVCSNRWQTRNNLSIIWISLTFTTQNCHTFSAECMTILRFVNKQKILFKEIQIILRLFLVYHLLLQTKSVSSQPASNVGGLVIHWTGLNYSLTVHSDV